MMRCVGQTVMSPDFGGSQPNCRSPMHGCARKTERSPVGGSCRQKDPSGTMLGPDQEQWPLTVSPTTRPQSAGGNMPAAFLCVSNPVSVLVSHQRLRLGRVDMGEGPPGREHVASDDPAATIDDVASELKLVEKVMAWRSRSRATCRRRCQSSGTTRPELHSLQEASQAARCMASRAARRPASKFGLDSALAGRLSAQRSDASGRRNSNTRPAADHTTTARPTVTPASPSRWPGPTFRPEHPGPVWVIRRDPVSRQGHQP